MKSSLDGVGPRSSRGKSRRRRGARRGYLRGLAGRDVDNRRSTVTDDREEEFAAGAAISAGLVASTPRPRRGFSRPSRLAAPWRRPPRNIHAEPAAPSRHASTEYPRGTRGVTATCLRGISTRHPRRRRDTPPRNIYPAPAVATHRRGVAAIPLWFPPGRPPTRRPTRSLSGVESRRARELQSRSWASAAVLPAGPRAAPSRTQGRRRRSPSRGTLR